MPLNRSLQDDPTHLGGGGANADAYLAIVGKKQGAIKGESQTPGHIDEIGVVAWRWGLSSPTDQATGLARGRRVYDPLEVDKLVDGSSTRLLNALANNEGLRSVTLGLRKAGAGAEDFFIVKLENARVISSKMHASPAGGLYETVAFSYQKISVDYHPQKSSGDRGAASNFSDDWEETPDS